MRQECEKCGKKHHVYSYRDPNGRVHPLCPQCAFYGGYKAQMSSAAIWAFNRQTSPALAEALANVTEHTREK